MPLKVTFELSDKDLRYFRKVMREARDAARHADETSILAAAGQLLEHVSKAEVPQFVKERLLKVRPMIDMLEDREWQLKGEDRERVLSALAYFNEPHDLIPDHVPGFGYMDDAIMVQLVVDELSPELEAYADFCAARKAFEKKRAARSAEAREKYLAPKRDSLQARMRRRRRARRGQGARAPRAPFTLW
ncbi:MAG: YkvA family protein [Myxococcales bacterium]|nr:YkvA family protein [Myxococcales bacterium]MDH5307767.1 YkvA family protein [Myxococcales bacterium]MDH5567604.1 YkvA family protein [Myxococcales bacterium]